MDNATLSQANDEVLKHLDSGIRPYVEVLRKEGIETFESCQGGPGHCCPDPMVRFHGGASEGYKAFAVAVYYGLPVMTLNRGYHVEDSQLVGPYWEFLFRKHA